MKINISVTIYLLHKPAAKLLGYWQLPQPKTKALMDMEVK